MTLLASGTQTREPDALIALLCLLGLLVLILTIIGCSMGSQRKIVVYDSRADLIVTSASIFLWACSGIALGSRSETPFVFRLLFLLSIVLTIDSIKRSVRVNKTAWEGILSVFAKYAFVVLIALSGMIAVFGTFSAVENAKKKEYKQATADAAFAAVGAAGFVSLRKLIRKLITEPRPICTPPSSTPEA